MWRIAVPKVMFFGQFENRWRSDMVSSQIDCIFLLCSILISFSTEVSENSALTQKIYATVFNSSGGMSLETASSVISSVVGGHGVNFGACRTACFTDKAPTKMSLNDKCSILMSNQNPKMNRWSL